MAQQITGEYIPVMVPTLHVQAVYELLGRLMAPVVAGDTSEEDPRWLIDDENGYWSESEVAYLALAVTGSSLERIIWAIVEASPGWIGFAELATKVSLDRSMLRAQLGTLTKYARKIVGRKSWPFTAKWAEGEMAYAMPLVVAEWWREIQLVYAEARQPPPDLIR